METINTAEAFRAAAIAQDGFSRSELARTFHDAVGGMRLVSTSVAEYRALDEATLLTLNTLSAEAVRLVQTQSALIAGEIARRSAPELGSQGLAQRAGHRNAEQFVKVTNGSTGRAATTAVRTGLLLGEMADEGSLDLSTGEISTPTQPWLRQITVALTAGEISVEQADAISFNLGVPNSAVTAEQLAALAAEL